MSAKMEMYKSKSQMKRHEKMEGAKEKMMEYGKKKVAKKAIVKKAVAKKKSK